MSETFIGNYRITSTLGEGGMGVVYAAQHRLLGRPAAIKVLLPQYSNKQRIVERFFNEAKAATAIKHPGIIEIYDFGYQDDGSAYIAMEFLDGEDLETRLRRLGRLPPPQAVQFTTQIASALAAAHEHGIIHRDLKPANVFLVPDPQVVGGERIKLLDFGIAKVSLDDQGDRTRAGVVMGTPTYMAPEQCLGAASVDARADLYSMGCILFEMVCGTPPFRAATSMDVMKAQLRQAPPRPGDMVPGLMPELEAIILRLLAKDAQERYQTAAEAEVALRGLLVASAPAVQAPAESAIPGRRRLVIPAAAMVTLAIGGAAFGVLTRREHRRAQASPAAAVAPQPVAHAGSRPQPVKPPLVFCAEAAPDCGSTGADLVTWRVRSKPARAQVVYDGDSRGETPMVIKVHRDPARTETLRLRLYDHADATLTLDAAGDRDELVELVPNVKIALFSKPPGAVIYDQSGAGLGVTPGEVGMAPGHAPVRLVLRLQGYQDEVVEVVPDKTKTRRVTMARLVTLRIESQPDGAEVWKDGARIGVTPHDDLVPRSGDEIDYEIKSNGFEAAHVTLRPRRDQSKRVVLEPLAGEER